MCSFHTSSLSLAPEPGCCLVREPFIVRRRQLRLRSGAADPPPPRQEVKEAPESAGPAPPAPARSRWMPKWVSPFSSIRFPRSIGFNRACSSRGFNFSFFKKKKSVAWFSLFLKSVTRLNIGNRLFLLSKYELLGFKLNISERRKRLFFLFSLNTVINVARRLL